MKKRLVIFGCGEIGQLAHYYFSRDSDYEVVAFTVDRDHLPGPVFCGLPVVAFDRVADVYPPSAYDFFVALSYSKLNAVRMGKYAEAKALGYKLASFISPLATVLNGGRIGDNCFVFEDNTIQPFVCIGDNVTLWSGNHIGHHGQIKDHVFFTSHVVLSGHCVVDSYSFFGVNSTIRDYLHIAEGTLVGMAAAVIKPTEAWGVYMGNPAEKRPIPSHKVY